MSGSRGTRSLSTRTTSLVVLAIGLAGLVVLLRFFSASGDQGPSQVVEPGARAEVQAGGDLQVTPPERTPPLADDPGDVAVAGSIRITDGQSRDSWVAFLGNGALSATCVDDGKSLTIPVHGGRFSFGSRCANAMNVAGLELQGLPVRLEEGQELSPGSENVVFCSWASLSIRLFVRERGSGRELPRVSIWSVANLLSIDGFGSPAIGPSDDDSAVLRDVQSPVTLSIAEGGQHAEICLPPLSSYGDVPPITVEFGPGEVRQLVLADLIGE